MGKVILEKPIVVQLDKKFPAFYVTRRFITVFTRAHHWSLLWARWIQSTLSHTISLKSILGLPSALFPSGFPTQILCAFLISHIRATYSDNLILFWLDHPYNIWWSVQVMKLLIMRSFSASRHSLPRASKHPLLHPVPKHPQSVFFP